jgi:peptidoglycan/xylan/chitin deacetylase (PgdA/CDA1 family)
LAPGLFRGIVAPVMTGTTRHLLERAFGAVERLITAVLYPLYLVAGRRDRVPILMYHQIGRPWPEAGAGGDAVSPENFARHMEVLARSGYEAVPLGALAAGAGGRRGGGRRRCVLTFDDGLRGQLEHACPVLERHGLPATFFLVAGALGSGRPLPHLDPGVGAGGASASAPAEWLPLSWEEARRLARGGFEIGSHALSHRSLGRLEAGEIELEARGSRQILERRLGVPVEFFAYPFGSRAYGDFDRRTRDLLLRAGYRGACTTVVGSHRPGDDAMTLKRIPIEDGDGPFRLRCKLAGAYDWVGPVKSLAQRVLGRAVRVDAALPAGWQGAGGARLSAAGRG